MKLSNRWYDSLKFIATIFIPALATFVGTVGIAVGYQELTGTLVTIISALGVFIGALIGLSSTDYKYQQMEDRDGNY